MVEKPEPALAPSNLGVVGRYVLMPRIFEHLRKQKPGAGGEIATHRRDPVAARATNRCSRIAIKGKRFDCGSKLGYLKATVEFALRHPEVATQFEAYLRAHFNARAEAGKVAEAAASDASSDDLSAMLA